MALQDAEPWGRGGKPNRPGVGTSASRPVGAPRYNYIL